MDKEFWLERWEREEIGFNQHDVNPYLRQYWPELKLASGSTVFVPLCGKSVDMRWLREQGHKVIGVELSELAVQMFFAEYGYKPVHYTDGKFSCYEANGIRIYCGDFFNLSVNVLAESVAVYDRASLIALPTGLREQYVTHLMSCLATTTQILLISFDYDQSEMSGPPFAVSKSEIITNYSGYAEIRILETAETLSQNRRFQERGLSRLHENIFLLTKR